MQACGGVNGGASPDGMGGGVLGVEGARLQMDAIPDGGSHPPEPAKAKLFVEVMVHVGEDINARRNHQLSQIMQLPMQDRRRAVYAFL